MSRARNIKPGFFKNDLLAECDPLARILFAGLWCEADREGRLEDRPKRLKAEYLAYDQCDADSLLNQLAARGFILRYVVDGKRYIAVIAFGSHQNPHVKEARSSIPAPDEHSSSPVQATAITGTDRADSPSLIPEELPTSSGAAAPLPDPIWGTGLDFLIRKGVTEKVARQLLGLVRKQVGDDLVVAELLIEAERDDIVDPSAWLIAAAKQRKGQTRGTHRESVAERADRKAREGDERDRLAGI